MNPFVSVLEINSFQDFLIANVYVGIFHYFNYIAIGGIYRPKLSYSDIPQSYPQKPLKVDFYLETAPGGYDRTFLFAALHDNMVMEGR